MSQNRKVAALNTRLPEAISPLQGTPERVLLVHSPVYDTRLNWGEWQQPTTLLRLATYWQAKGVQVQHTQCEEPNVSLLQRINFS